MSTTASRFAWQLGWMLDVGAVHALKPGVEPD